MKPFRVLAIAAILVGLGGVAVALRPPTVVTAETDQQRALADLIAPHGLVFEPMIGAQGLASVVANPVGVERAAAVAEEAYGRGPTPIVHQGILTVTDIEPTIVRRPIYVVQLPGRSIPPFGPTRGPANSEQLVFVDASTGAEVVAMSVR